MKIVFSCGVFEDDSQLTNTVEIYDNIVNTWSSMSNMISSKRNHSMIANKTKLYVFDSFFDYEVFDKYTNKFTCVNILPIISNSFAIDKITFSIGNKIAMFGRKSSKIETYDTEI